MFITDKSLCMCICVCVLEWDNVDLRSVHSLAE